MIRPTKDQYFLRMAHLVASRSTCLRRAVGCVLTNARGHVLATGYNGVAAGQPHCNEPKQEGADFKPWGGDPHVLKPERMVTMYPHACDGSGAATGTQLERCEAIHAEQNALLQCRDVFAIDTCYCTVEPCITCVKLLLNTGCQRVVFAAAYAGAGRALWDAARDPGSWVLAGEPPSP